MQSGQNRIADQPVRIGQDRCHFIACEIRAHAQKHGVRDPPQQVRKLLVQILPCIAHIAVAFDERRALVFSIKAACAVATGSPRSRS